MHQVSWLQGAFLMGGETEDSVGLNSASLVLLLDD